MIRPLTLFSLAGLLRLAVTLDGGIFAISVQAGEEDWRSKCATVSELAEIVMKNRQEGAAMSKMIEVAKGNETIERIVIAAFKKPRLYTEDAQQRIVEEFRDDVYLKCVLWIKELEKKQD